MKISQIMKDIDFILKFDIGLFIGLIFNPC